MAILSVSLTPELEKFINDDVASGEFESKGQIIRKALREFKEDLLLKRLNKSVQDFKDGKYYEGDLMEIVEKIK